MLELGQEKLDAVYSWPLSLQVVGNTLIRFSGAGSVADYVAGLQAVPCQHHGLTPTVAIRTLEIGVLASSSDGLLAATGVGLASCITDQPSLYADAYGSLNRQTLK